MAICKNIIFFYFFSTKTPYKIKEAEKFRLFYLNANAV